MTDRSADIVVYWQLDPRAIVLNKSASTPDSMNMQDLADSIRAIEKTSAAMDQEVLLSTSGKQDLGGSTSVGITNTLQNAAFGFESRTVSLSDNTVTTPDTGGRSLISSAATFITDGVTVGDEVLNLTDSSITTVRAIISETEITCFQLEDGDSNQFNLNDRVKIWKIVQCSIEGGNLVAVDSVGTTISQIFKTANTQIKLAASTSGTLIGLTSIETDLTAIDVLLNRLLGLVQENQYIDNTSFDSNNNMTSARLRTYSVAGSVGSDSNVLATYTITATYNSSSELLTYQVVKQ